MFSNFSRVGVDGAYVVNIFTSFPERFWPSELHISAFGRCRNYGASCNRCNGATGASEVIYHAANHIHFITSLATFRCRISFLINLNKKAVIQRISFISPAYCWLQTKQTNAEHLLDISESLQSYQPQFYSTQILLHRENLHPVSLVR